MRTIAIEIPDDVLSRTSDDELERELKLAAAIHWYRQGKIAQGRAAEFAGVTRQTFLEALYRAGVCASQVTPEELAKELGVGSS